MKHFILALFIALFSNVCAQDDGGNLLMGGKIVDDQGGSLNAPIVQITVNGKRKTANCSSDGSFEFYLDFDQVYDVSFHARKHQPKLIEVDTRRVPEDEKIAGYEYSGFIVELKREKRPSLPNKVARIFYDDGEANFTYEKK